MNVNKNNDMKNIKEIKSKNGDIKYRVQVRKDGNANPAKTFRSLKEAKAYRSKCEIEAYDATNPVAKPNYNERFSQTIIFYINDITKTRRKETSRNSELPRLKNFLRNYKKFCNCITSKMREEDINALINARLKEVSPASVRREFTLLKGVFKHSMKRLRIKQSPFNSEYINIPVGSEPRDRILNTHERKLFHEELNKSKSPWLFNIIRFLEETGMRRGELISLTFQDVKYNQDGTGSVKVYDVKNSKHPNTPINREVPLTDVAIDIIKNIEEKLRNQNELIFPLKADAVTKMFIRFIKKIGIKDYHLHDLRHERITSLANAGTPIHIIQKVTGHRDPRSVNRYINPDNEIAHEYLKKAQERSL